MANAELDADVGVVRLQTSWNQKELIKQVPGARWDATAKNWTVPASWASLVTLRGVLGDALVPTDALATWSWQLYRDRVEPALKLREAMELDDDGSPEAEVIKSWRSK